eukprot:SAG31_NODE_1859_length_7052_cov_4.965051_5_plen_74_part_00
MRRASNDNDKTHRSESVEDLPLLVISSITSLEWGRTPPVVSHIHSGSSKSPKSDPVDTPGGEKRKNVGAHARE